MRIWPLLVTVTAWASCFSPAFPQELQCGDGDQPCPPGQACGPDDFCYFEPSAGHDGGGGSGGDAGLGGTDGGDAGPSPDAGPLVAGCRGLKEANAGLGDGVYDIDTGTGTASVFCDMATDGGGWTFVGHINSDYAAGRFFEQDLGTYAADRSDSATTYGLGATVMQRLAHTQMMIALDFADPATSQAATVLRVFNYAPGDAAFRTGPVPCAPSGAFGFRTTTTGGFTPTAFAYCDANFWGIDGTGGATEALIRLYGLQPLGVLTRLAWGHDAWIYVR